MSECQGDLMSATAEVDASWTLAGGELPCGATVLQNHARVMDVGRNTVRRALAAGGRPCIGGAAASPPPELRPPIATGDGSTQGCWFASSRVVYESDLIRGTGVSQPSD